MKWRTGLLLGCVVLAFAGSVANAGTITQMVVFGDSLVDTGNFFIGSGFTVPASPPYFNGRFSNGPVWVEDLAGRLGVASPAPSLAGGTNYAFATAETGSGFFQVAPGAFVPNIGTQINTYLSSHQPQTGQLFVISGGANDFLHGQTNPAVPVANLAADITALAQAGATTFLVPNLGMLGGTPFGLSLSAAQRTGLDALSLSFDSLLAQELNQLRSSLGVTIYSLDALSLFNEIQANPLAFGFTDVVDQAKSGGLGLPGTVVPNPDQYLFWDPLHPTAHVHSLLADEAAFALGVPEPSSCALLLCGVVGLLGYRWRSRRRTATVK
jgi:phospholipase/lecithinase/hemolysin